MACANKDASASFCNGVAEQAETSVARDGEAHGKLDILVNNACGGVIRAEEMAEVGSMVAYFAPPESALVAGQVISVNGGSAML